MIPPLVPFIDSCFSSSSESSPPPPVPLPRCKCHGQSLRSAWAWQHGAQPLFPSGERGLDCRRNLNQLLVLPVPPSRVGARSALCSLLYILNDSHVFYAARSQGERCAHCTYRRRQELARQQQGGARPRKGAPQVGAHNEHCQRNANKHGKCVLKA